MMNKSKTNMSKNLYQSDITQDRFKNLGYAIIRQALDDIINQTTKDRTSQQKRNAILWLTSSKKHSFSFLWLCEKVELDPIIIFRQIDKYIQEQNMNKQNRISQIKEDLQLIADNVNKQFDLYVRHNIKEENAFYVSTTSIKSVLLESNFTDFEKIALGVELVNTTAFVANYELEIDGVKFFWSESLESEE